MNSKMIKWGLSSLMAMAVLTAPLSTQAADPGTNAPATAPIAPLHKRQPVLPYHGKIVAVDNKAKTLTVTLTVGTLVLLVSNHTRIVKDGQPSMLEQGVVGEYVSGAYRKSDDGKLHALSISFGTHAEAKHRQPTAGSTNGVAAPN
jgi:hypothetical protein